MNLKPARTTHSKPIVSVSVQPGLQSETLSPKRKKERLESGRARGVAQAQMAYDSYGFYVCETEITMPGLS